MDIFLSIGSNGQIKCPVDMCLSIGSNGQLKCPMDICMSNGSIGSNGPLDILPLPSHRPVTCMGLMPTYDVFRDNLLNAQPNVQWTYACPLDPMDKSNVHWTYLVFPLDPMDNSNDHWTYACPMDPLDPMDHWTFSLCHLTGLLPAWGRCQHMTSFEITYLMHNQMYSGLMPVHWIQWTNQMSTGHIYVHWTSCRGIGH